jgi:hypothetical protein
MSYLSSYATRNPPVRGPGLDEKLPLNLPDFDGGAYVRVFVEDTTFRVAASRATPAHPATDRRLLERNLALVRASFPRGACQRASQDQHAARRSRAVPRRA